MASDVHHPDNFVLCLKRNADESLQALGTYQIRANSTWIFRDVLQQDGLACLGYSANQLAYLRFGVCCNLRIQP